ncbi:Zinc knuckle [Popillia japonica]|uniref:Zinc knuckle n=1 Tax=Popillia japonica TaxID=7064 RepID=A0AAW1HFE6_POPJA
MSDADEESININVSPRSVREVIGAGSCSTASTEGSNMSDLSKVLEMMVVQNKRRDEVLERVLEQINNRNSYQVMPDLTKNVATFDGNIGARDWIRKIKSMQTLHQWPDSFALEIARSNLIGGAHHWWCTKENEIKTFTKFVEVFEKTFLRIEGFPVKWKKMVARIQRKGEPLSEYYHNKVRLCTDLNLTFADVKEQILIGLYDRNMCSAMLGREHKDKDTDQLFHDLIGYELIDSARIEKVREIERKGIAQTENRTRSEREKKDQKSHAKLPDRDSQDKPHKQRIEQDLRERKRIRKVMRSYQTGTVRINRSATIAKRHTILTCFTCKNEGHISRQCPSNNTKRETLTINEKDAVLVELDKLEKGMQKEVVLGGLITVKGLIDTGSGVCTIKKSIVENHNMRILPGCITLMGFGNSATKTMGKVNTMITIDDAEVERTDIHIVDTKAQEHDIIIGRSFIEDPEVTYIGKGGCLYFMKNDMPFGKMKVASDTYPVLRVSEDCMIEKNRINCIEVDAGDKTCAIPINFIGDGNITVERGTRIGKLPQPDEQGLTGISEITMDEIRLGEEVTRDQAEELLELLQKYRECFAMSIDELGCT